jgi:geranylgeranyl diphosphate synthase type I
MTATPLTEPGSSASLRADFAVFARGVQSRVEARLDVVARERIAAAQAVSPDAGVVVASLFDLARRGGKRVRPVLMTAAYAACGGAPEDPAVVDAGAAFEVLQAYLLIHDDWMDDDDVRRGGPAVHASLRERFGSRAMGDACAVLAGDYGQAVAFDVLARIDGPPSRVLAVVAEASRMLANVVTGQIVDVRGTASTRDDVDAMHRLKTSSYTTTSPFAIGAILAGASPNVVETLREAGDALGLAFQLVDDVLGTFGDPARTGKPARSDLRRGKKTALVAELAGDREAEMLLPRVLGVEDAPDDEVDAVVARMIKGGAKARVEARIETLTADARRHIERAALPDDRRTLLLQAAEALQGRNQ